MRNAIRHQVTVPLLVGGLQLTRDSQRCPGEPKPLAVEVIYTNDEGTQHALRKAWSLAQDLGAYVRLVFVYAVPYALPLGQPAISLRFLRNKLVKLASEFPGQVSVHIFLCRETRRDLRDALPETCLVVLGDRRRWWWPTKGQWMEKRLKNLGHDVIFAESG